MVNYLGLAFCRPFDLVQLVAPWMVQARGHLKDTEKSIYSNDIHVTTISTGIWHMCFDIHVFRSFLTFCLAFDEFQYELCSTH